VCELQLAARLMLQCAAGVCIVLQDDSAFIAVHRRTAEAVPEAKFSSTWSRCFGVMMMLQEQ
jgi:hypothetical protein